jgi:hypothetical protein
VKSSYVLRLLALVSVSVLGSQMSQAQSFDLNRLVVLRVGTGSAALSNAGTAVFLDQFNTTGAGQSASATVALPSSGTGRIVTSGTASSEGMISFNPINNSITVPGYDADAGTTGIVATTSGATNRVVNSVDLSGNVNRIAAFTTSFNTNNIRGAYSNGSNTWAAGSGTGIVSVAPETVVSTTSTNTRAINSFNGNLYFSTGAGSSRGVFQVGTGLPTTSTTSTLVFGDGATSSAYSFSFSADGNTAFVADDRTSGAGGGVQKWTFDGTNWSKVGTYNNSGGTRGLVVDYSGASPVLYATTTEASANFLIAFTDNNNFAQSPILLAQAAVNTAFRGVILTPVPEPATIFGASALALGAFGLIRRRMKSNAVVAA